VKPLTATDKAGQRPRSILGRVIGALMGRYRLLTQHMIGGHLLEAGTEVGEGTGYPVSEPSNQMEGVDETAKGRINELHQKLYGSDAPWHDAEHPLAQVQQDAEAAQAQREEEASQEPVSHQQAWERGHDEFRGAKLSGPPGGPLVSRSISGDTSSANGPWDSTTGYERSCCAAAGRETSDGLDAQGGRGWWRDSTAPQTVIGIYLSTWIKP
jgi:hypothetical protein